MLGGQGPSQQKHNLMLALGLDSDKDNGALNEKKGMKPPREGHYLNQGKGPKVKQLMFHLKIFPITRQKPP